MLSQEESLGLKILAYLRTGNISSFDCSTCDERFKEMFNCSCKEQDESVYFHPEIGEFTACPVRFIPDNIFEFSDQYDYLEMFPNTANKYEDTNHRFWEAYKKFKSELNTLELKKYEK